MIDPKTLEQEFDPRGGDMGRNRRYAYDRHTGKYSPLPSTEGLALEQVDLRGYSRYTVGGQDVFPVHGASGGLTAMEWRAWWRREAGRYYVIVFESEPACFSMQAMKEIE